jgi:hypothetical protein
MCWQVAEFNQVNGISQDGGRACNGAFNLLNLIFRGCGRVGAEVKITTYT